MSPEDSVELTYEISDGYAGGARPQYCQVFVEDFDPGLTDEQIQDQLYSIAEDDMQQNIGVSISEREMKELIQKIRNYQSEEAGK